MVGKILKKQPNGVYEVVGNYDDQDSQIQQYQHIQLPPIFQ